MEADSTTYDGTKSLNEGTFPFPVNAGNLKLYRDFIENNGDKQREHQLVERMHAFGLLPESVQCVSPDCKVVKKTARVIDKIQWYCECCRKSLPIRTQSFFLRLQCSLLQSLQVILAWCEDADLDLVTEHFKIKSRVASLIYDRLDKLAAKEQSKYKLGGRDSVVLAEMYPDCLNRLSPDTTDQPHMHRILMLADTNHIPTHYQLHVIREDSKKNAVVNSTNSQALISEIEGAISQYLEDDSTLVAGGAMPNLEGTVSMQQLSQHCQLDMQHFLSTRIWRQAVTLCTAGRELCSATPCSAPLQQYLDSALYRLRFGDGFYHHILALIAREYSHCDS